MAALPIDQITHADIEALLPHKGSMCLLERVLGFDQQQVMSSSNSHRSENNPLRTAAGLAGAVAIEYGAQAAALHRGLLARAAGNRNAPRRGLLVQVREVNLYVQRLDTLAPQLLVQAWRAAEVGDAVQYRFAVSAANEVEDSEKTAVAEGELLVVLS